MSLWGVQDRGANDSREERKVLGWGYLGRQGLGGQGRWQPSPPASRILQAARTTFKEADSLRQSEYNPSY